MEDIKPKISKCVKNLTNKIKVRRSLKRLLEIDVNRRVFHELGVMDAISPFVNAKSELTLCAFKYLSNPDYSDIAKEVRSKIVGEKKEKKFDISTSSKRLVSNSTDDGPPPKKNNFCQITEDETFMLALEGKLSGSSHSSHSKEKERRDKERRDKERKNKEKREHEVEQQFKASTLNALGDSVNFDITKAPKLYQTPAAFYESENPRKTNNIVIDDSMFKPRKDRRKVFAGSSKQPKITEVQSLVSLSQNALMANPKFLTRQNVGLAPYFLMKPIISKFTPKQLDVFVNYNPLLEIEADEIFQGLARREFPGVQMEPEYDTWRHFYNAKTREKALFEKNKLERLTNKISERAKSMDAGRRTQVITEAHAPRNIRRRQASNGIGSSLKATPSASELSQARKAVGEGNRAKLASLPSAVVARNSSLGAHHGLKAKPQIKMAPLMKKTMKMLNIKRR